MKTASMVLGIVGGALAILGGICLVFAGLYMFPTMFNLEGFNLQSERFFDMFTTIYIVLGILMAAGGILGLIGGTIVKNNNKTAGALMITGTVLCFGNILLLLGGIFALIREKQPVYPPYPPYPGQPQYPQYPSQPQYPNQDPQNRQ